jgi:hypothetical protein
VHPQVVPAPAQVHHLQALTLIQALLTVVPAQAQALPQAAQAPAHRQAVQAQVNHPTAQAPPQAVQAPAPALAQAKWLYKRRKKSTKLC